jgi:predicted GIY-YIG superfamily endonuclease
VTGDLAERTWQHKNDLIDGFTKKYGELLVWFEE